MLLQFWLCAWTLSEVKSQNCLSWNFIKKKKIPPRDRYKHRVPEGKFRFMTNNTDNMTYLFLINFSRFFFFL